MFSFSKAQTTLLLGDLLVIAAVTLIGFATHRTLATAGLRIFSTFLPLSAAWLLVGLSLEVFDPDQAARLKKIWRPFWAMILAAPLFGLFRSWMLGTDSISSLFIVIMGSVSSFAMLLWRAIYAFLRLRR